MHLQYFQKGRMTGENIAKRSVEKHPVPIAVYKNNVHKSGINLNGRFSDRQKNTQKCYGLNEGKLDAQMKTPRKTMCQLTKSACELRIDTSMHTANYKNQHQKELLKLCPCKITGTQQLFPPEWETREQ